MKRERNPFGLPMKREITSQEFKDLLSQPPENINHIGFTSGIDKVSDIIITYKDGTSEEVEIEKVTEISNESK